MVVVLVVVAVVVAAILAMAVLAMAVVVAVVVVIVAVTRHVRDDCRCAAMVFTKPPEHALTTVLYVMAFAAPTLQTTSVIAPRHHCTRAASRHHTKTPPSAAKPTSKCAVRCFVHDGAQN